MIMVIQNVRIVAVVTLTWTICTHYIANVRFGPDDSENSDEADEAEYVETESESDNENVPTE